MSFLSGYRFSIIEMEPAFMSLGFWAGSGWHLVAFLIFWFLFACLRLSSRKLQS